LTFSGNNPYQLAAFRDGRPLEAAIIRPLKLVILASETTFIKKALWNYNKMAHLYSGAKGFIPLHKDDVDTKFMPDDSIFLFDLRQKITKDTDVEDLYETAKVPRIDKLWGVAKKTTTYNNNTTTGGNAAAKTTGAANTNTNVTGKKSHHTSQQASTKHNDTTKASDKSAKGPSRAGSDPTKRGRVWNSFKNAYDVSSSEDIDKIEGIESVEINTETGEVQTPDHSATIVDGEEPNKSFSKDDDSKKDSFALEETTAGKIENEPTSKAKVTQVDFEPVSPEIESRDKEVASHLRSIAEEGSSAGVKQKVNMETHPKVLERSIGFAGAAEKFKTNNDICNFLEIADVKDLTNMPLPSLINRAQKKLLSQGWYKGYIARMIEKGDDSGLITNTSRSMFGRLRSKKVEAQNHVRQLKLLIKLLSEASGVSYPELEGFVTKALNRGDEITTQMLTTVFSPGDLRENRVMRNLVSLVQSKEGR